MKPIHFLPIFLFIYSCQQVPKTPERGRLEKVASSLRNYDSLSTAEVMVVGTFHFGKEVLGAEEQASLQDLIKQLGAYSPTKIVLEWEPHRMEEVNTAYQAFLQDSFDIAHRNNEVYQLGFRLAQELGHDSLYLFDDQTEYIGSLEAFGEEDDPFSFDLFLKYAEEEDAGFYDKHLEPLQEIFGQNQALLKELRPKDRIALLNSPEKQKINAQRMHMLELRIGIQKNWVGPDWLGRWYRRNLRMLANTLKLAEQQDRLLIIVGDNHKWALDQMYEATPDFTLVDSWEYLK